MEAAPSKSIQTKSPVLPRKRDESSRYLWAARVGGGKGREEEEERERERERSAGRERGSVRVGHVTAVRGEGRALCGALPAGHCLRGIACGALPAGHRLRGIARGASPAGHRLRGIACGRCGFLTSSSARGSTSGRGSRLRRARRRGSWSPGARARARVGKHSAWGRRGMRGCRDASASGNQR